MKYYKEIARPAGTSPEGVARFLPDHCPVCGATIVDYSDTPCNVGGLQSCRYACGGAYVAMDQIQNHTDIWRGSCGGTKTETPPNASTKTDSEVKALIDENTKAAERARGHNRRQRQEEAAEFWREELKRREGVKSRAEDKAAKHTPGPWHWKIKSIGPCFIGSPTSPNGCKSYPLNCSTCPNARGKSPSGKDIKPEGPINLMAESGYRIVSVATLPYRDEDGANARLIAAAPELLAALETLVSWADNDPERNGYDFVQQARAAIAKAKGE